MKHLDVSLGILLNQQGEVLLGLRDPAENLWEFPGGKQEGAETDYQALCREMHEELGIVVQAATFFDTVFHRYEQYSVRLNAWLVTAYANLAYGAEGQLVEWIATTSLPQMKLPGANDVIVTRLLKLTAN